MKKSGFLKGYLIVMIVSTLLGGYFVFSSRSHYIESKDSFKASKNTVAALKSSKIYPDSNNLKEKQKQVADYVEAVGSLKAKVLENQSQLNSDFTEQSFRKLMEDETVAIAEMAEKEKLTLPEEFAFGMEAYNRGKQVQAGALSRLEWELNAIKRFVTIAADSGVSSIDDFSRDEFKLETVVEKTDEEESNAARSSRGTSSRSRSRGRRNNDKPASTNPMAGAEKVMETYRFTSEITASYEALTALLNGIAADKNYFLWLRKIRIENERQTSPREGDAPGPTNVEGVVPDEQGNVPKIDATVLFGNEKMKARLFIDAVRFKEDLVKSEAVDADKKST